MTDLSALTDDELLAEAQIPRASCRAADAAAAELRRRLSAGERAEKDVTRMALAIRELSEEHEQAEARVAELERELVTANKRALDDVLAVLDRALSAGSETSDKPWPIGDQPSCPIAGPCDGECGLCKPSAGSEGSDK